MRSPALAAANCAKPALPRKLPDAPVKITVPRPSGASRRAASQEPGKAADPPELLKELRWELAEIYPLVVTGVEDDKVGWLATAAGVHGAVKQPNHVDSRVASARTASALPPAEAIVRTTCSILAGVRPATST